MCWEWESDLAVARDAAETRQDHGTTCIVCVPFRVSSALPRARTVPRGAGGAAARGRDAPTPGTGGSGGPGQHTSRDLCALALQITAPWSVNLPLLYTATFCAAAGATPAVTSRHTAATRGARGLPSHPRRPRLRRYRVVPGGEGEGKGPQQLEDPHEPGSPRSNGPAACGAVRARASGAALEASVEACLQRDAINPPTGRGVGGARRTRS